ncbi:MAG TPA: hypothetical protein ENJ95_11395 [Bacteroidetes bacterium]|nr:hypothetical protein [Bacteroidota bacterium]
MQKSRLFELFSAFSKTEKRELGKFVHSPVFNQRQDVAALYQYFYENAGAKDPQTFARKTVFAALFPAEKYSAAKMDYTMSFLFRVLKSYLVFKEQTSNAAANQIALARALRKRNLGRLFDKEYKIAERLLEKSPFRDAGYHFDKYQLLLEEISITKQGSRNLAGSFSEFSSELTTYFIAKKLWQACSAVMYKTVWKAEVEEEDILEAILNHVQANDYSGVPAVNLYYHCYKALTETDSLRWFEALRNLTRSHFASLRAAEVRDLYLVAINYCIRRFNNGEKDFLKEAFNLYKEGLQLGTFLENNMLSRFTYNNIVMAGLLLKEFIWVKQFLSDYREYIEPRFRESTYNYNLAIYYYQKPDYGKAMTLLQQADFDDVMHNLNARRILLKIYFEENELEALASHITSFKNYIYRRKELGSYHRELYLNFLKYTQRILALGKYDKKAAASLKKEIEKVEPVAEKGWLLQVLGK